MGKRITIYLNEYYYNLFERIREKIKEEKGIYVNNTDLIKMGLICLKKSILKED